MSDCKAFGELEKPCPYPHPYDQECFKACVEETVRISPPPEPWYLQGDELVEAVLEIGEERRKEMKK